MINHARTLLLNVPGDNRPGLTPVIGGEPETSVFFLEEYIPNDFRPVALTKELKAFYDAIYGKTSDNAFKNFRAWQFMTLLHSTEFSTYVTDLDKRVTYLSKKQAVDIQDTVLTEAISSSAADYPLYALGNIDASAANPILINEWVLTALGSNLIQARHVQTNAILETTVSFSSGLSSTIQLPAQKDFTAKIGGSSLPVGGVWKISAFNKPTADLSDLLVFLAENTHLVSPLFNIKDEPFSTFKKMWENGMYIQYRLSGVLLAFVYCVEKLRNG